MREQNEVEPGNRIAQQLRAEVGRRVDQKVFSVPLDLHRLPQPLVARVIRGANGAPASDDGNACGGAGAEKRNDHGTSKVQSSRFKVKGKRTLPRTFSLEP